MGRRNAACRVSAADLRETRDELIELCLDLGGAFELHLESYLDFLQQLLVPVEANEDGLDDGLERRQDLLELGSAGLGGHTSAYQRLMTALAA